MTFRELADSGAAQSGLSTSRRIDDVVAGLAELYRKQELLVHALNAILEQEVLDQLDHESDIERRVRAAAQQLGRPDAAEWLARKTAEARAQPNLSTDRSPRSGRATPGRNVLATEIDPKTGQIVRAFGQSPLQPGE
jgi:hypothetical protein